MNKFAVSFIILLFLVLLAVGVLAVRQQLILKSQASIACPVAKIPLDTTCPNETKLELVKNSQGCYIFACK